MKMNKPKSTTAVFRKFPDRLSFLRKQESSILCCIILLLSFSNCLSAAASSPFSNDPETRKIIRRSQIEDEARQLEEAGRYDEAIARYREAISPRLLNYEGEAGVARGGIQSVYIKQGKYEEALKELQWHLDRNPEKYEDTKLELLALIKSRDTHSPEPVYQHIEYLKEKYKDQLPPNTGAYDDIVASAIIRLYDHVADFDAGVAFAEGFLKRCASGKSCRGDDKKLAYTPKHPYFQIKQAFLEDKAEGFKGCLNAKPSQSEGGQATPQDFGGQAGEACMGRATQALIESDYFPW